MAKIFYTEIPNQESLQATFAQVYPGIDSQSIYTFMLLRKLSTDLDISLESYFSQYNLSVGRFTLLNLLSYAPQGMTPSELAVKVGVTQATISGLVNSLEKSELVIRQSHQKDGRSFVITLTDKGGSLVKQIAPHYYTQINKLMTRFPETERTALNELFVKLIDSLPQLNIQTQNP